MFHFNFAIKNPFHTNCHDNITNYLVKNYKINKNKNFEIQLCRAGSMCNLFSIEVDTRCSRRDHAGFNFDLDLCGYVVILNLIDRRHWDFEHDKWYE